jgi:hypothetical protein
VLFKSKFHEATYLISVGKSSLFTMVGWLVDTSFAVNHTMLIFYHRHSSQQGWLCAMFGEIDDCRVFGFMLIWFRQRYTAFYIFISF